MKLHKLQNIFSECIINLVNITYSGAGRSRGQGGVRRSARLSTPQQEEEDAPVAEEEEPVPEEEDAGQAAPEPEVPEPPAASSSEGSPQPGPSTAGGKKKPRTTSRYIFYKHQSFL